MRNMQVLTHKGKTGVASETQRLTMKQMQWALTKQTHRTFKPTHAFFFVSLLSREVWWNFFIEVFKLARAFLWGLCYPEKFVKLFHTHFEFEHSFVLCACTGMKVSKRTSAQAHVYVCAWTHARACAWAFARALTT